MAILPKGWKKWGVARRLFGDGVPAQALRTNQSGPSRVLHRTWVIRRAARYTVNGQKCDVLPLGRNVSLLAVQGYRKAALSDNTLLGTARNEAADGDEKCEAQSRLMTYGAYYDRVAYQPAGRPAPPSTAGGAAE